MTRTIYRLILALLLSLLLHLAPFIGDLIQPAKSPAPAPPPAIRAELRALTQATPIPLLAPVAAKQAKIEKTAKIVANPTKTSTPPLQWQHEVRRQFKKQDDKGQFYPAEAIALGLQGEVVIFMIVDTDGKVVAARVEQGSGHKILDEAALNAVRSLHSLPANAPRETLLPVRFRLN